MVALIKTDNQPTVILNCAANIIFDCFADTKYCIYFTVRWIIVLFYLYGFHPFPSIKYREIHEFHFCRIEMIHPVITGQ